MTCPVYERMHFSQGTRKKRPCLSGRVVNAVVNHKSTSYHLSVFETVGIFVTFLNIDFNIRFSFHDVLKNRI